MSTLKNKNLLSFEDDQEDQEVQQSSFRKNKIKSSHDVLQNDPTLSNKEAINKQILEEQKQKKEQKERQKEQLIKNVRQAHTSVVPKDENTENNGANIDQAANQLQSQIKKGKRLNIEAEIEKLDAHDKKRKRSRSRSQEMNPTEKAIKRATQRRHGQKFRNRHSSSKSKNSSDSGSESDYESNKMTDAQIQQLAKTREEYNNLKADILQFKQTKIGTLLDESNLNVQARVSALDLQRQKFLNSMKNTKNRENETLSKLRDFSSKLKSKDVKQDQTNWMNAKLRFHIDSQKAYDVNKKVQEQSKSGFENFALGGNENKKYQNAYANVKRPDLGDDVIQNINMEEFVSMQELIELASKNKEHPDFNNVD